MLFKKLILDVIELSVVSIHMRGVLGPKKLHFRQFIGNIFANMLKKKYNLEEEEEMLLLFVLWGAGRCVAQTHLLVQQTPRCPQTAGFRSVDAQEIQRRNKRK